MLLLFLNAATFVPANSGMNFLEVILTVVALIQFPMYGLLYDSDREQSGTGYKTIAVVTAHCLVAFAGCVRLIFTDFYA